jgi:hypothetical protein
MLYLHEFLKRHRHGAQKRSARFGFPRISFCLRGKTAFALVYVVTITVFASKL